MDVIDNMLDDAFGRILEIMAQKNISQKELADHLGVGAQKVSDWKIGKIKSYRKYLPEIASFLNVDINELVGTKNKNPAIETDDGKAKILYEKLMNAGIDVEQLSDKEIERVISLIKIGLDK